jgi:hypothetical protein
MPEVRKLWQTEGLFSDHYLRARLKNNEWWPTDAAAKPIWQFCKELYEKRAFALRRYPIEVDTRREFIHKVLAKLGFAWSDNLRLPDTKQDLEPDYILYNRPRGQRTRSSTRVSLSVTGWRWRFWKPKDLGIPSPESVVTRGVIPINRFASTCRINNDCMGHFDQRGSLASLLPAFQGQRILCAQLRGGP